MQEEQGSDWREIFPASYGYLPDFAGFSPERQYFSRDVLRQAAQVAV